MNRFKQRYHYSLVLLRELVVTDFKLRYQGSALGYLWSLLRPLFLFAVLYFVFTQIVHLGGKIPHYPQYLLLGILLWNYFLEVTVGSTGAIVGKGDLLRKISFPKYVIILAVSFSAFINLLLNFIVLGVFMAFGHIGLTWDALLMVPIVAELFIFSIALAFFLSALFVRFRDISYIWEVIMQAAFYAAPILYSLDIVPHRIAQLMMLNPIAQIIQDARYALITKDTQTISHVYAGRNWVWVIPIGIVLIALMFSTAYFKRQASSFAENV